MTENDSFKLFYLILLLAFVGSSLIVHYRNRLGSAAKNALIWLLVIIILIITYSYKSEFQDIKNRLIGELIPSKSIINQNGSVSFRTSSNGHYILSAEVNRTNIQFMLDTGASDIVLTKQDAQKIGVNLNGLKFNKIYNTANGTVRGASIIIDRLKIGHIIMYDVKASVNGAKMEKSLLGMSFLKELDGYEVKDGILYLWP